MIWWAFYWNLKSAWGSLEKPKAYLRENSGKIKHFKWKKSEFILSHLESTTRTDDADKAHKCRCDFTFVANYWIMLKIPTVQILTWLSWKLRQERLKSQLIAPKEKSLKILQCESGKADKNQIIAPKDQALNNRLSTRQGDWKKVADWTEKFS